MKVSVTYKWKFPIQRIWPYFKETEKMNDVIADLEPHITFLNDKKHYEKGSEYCNEITRLSMKIYNKVEESIDTEMIKMQKVLVTITTPIEIKYENIFTLFSNSVDNSTNLLWDIILLDVDMNKLTFYDILIEDMKKKNVDLLDQIKKFVKKQSKQVNQMESILLNKPSSKIWSIVSDFAKFAKLVPLVADKAEYDGDPLKGGTKLTLKWKSKNLVCYLKVISVEVNESQGTWVYTLQCYDGIPKVPEQTLILFVRKVNDNSCYLSFTHLFKYDYKNDFTENLSKQKKCILNKLRDSLS